MILSGRCLTTAKLIRAGCFLFLLIWLNLLLTISSVQASTYLDIDDETYYILNRLEAEGIIKSALLSTKPISRKEVVRLIKEAETNSVGKNQVIEQMVAVLKKWFKDDLEKTNYIKPVDTFYLKYSFDDSNLQILNYNNDGDKPGKGSNVRLGLISRAESKWFSVYVNPEFRYSEQFTDVKVKKVYGVLSLFGLDLMAGKDSQWWGPGYHGSILLSNNSEPLEFVRLTNPEPVVLPWIFKYIGPIRAAFFAGRLEKNRSDFSEPILWGLNVNFKPVSYLELGLERTAIMGGKGRSESLATWWRSFTGVGENDGRESGDQRAGYYAKLTLPFKWQPVQFYVEADGEDQRNSFPSKWAYLAGIYLPKIAGLERFDLRGEFSTNHIGEYPNVWYSHHIYTQGYTYKGRIIGHHMGSDSKDIFVEASYLIPGSYGRISLSYDREEHNTSLAVREKKDEIELKGIIQLVKGLELKAMYGFGSVKNVGNVPSDRQLINIFAAELMYRF